MFQCGGPWNFLFLGSSRFPAYPFLPSPSPLEGGLWWVFFWPPLKRCWFIKGEYQQKPTERSCPICKIEMEDEYHFLNYMPCLPGKTMFVTRLFGKKIRIKISRMSPDKIFMFLINSPSGNVKIQKMIAKHIFECLEKRKWKTAKLKLGLN